MINEVPDFQSFFRPVLNSANSIPPARSVFCLRNRLKEVTQYSPLGLVYSSTGFIR